MRKHIFVFIRYSVVLKSRKNNWIVGREDDFEGYKKSVFKPERLRARRKLFETVTLSSLDRQQSMNNVTVVIMTSDELPEEEKRALDSFCDSRPWVKVVELNEDEKNYEKCIRREVKALNDDVLYASVRLDDDDALASDFFIRLSGYLEKENIDRIISLGLGYAGIYSDSEKRFSEFKRYYYPKIAIGLAKISYYDKRNKAFSSGSIYADGRHTIVDQKSVTLLDSRSPSFIRLIHSSADTVGVHDRKIAKMEAATPEEVGKHFDFELLDK
ncbi:hypothetical protein IT774_01830 [Salinimonas marina]|uniref:Rhamnosyl transferase n=1 Tax=Salinimonas marina TaxID=2785918 RepID=A0A7S9HDA7_9ALTE|nr:glycosyltransferase [Salinimonas marina]QPG06020.1 hypothetical protein IT774_01830 [Salinimonas marina]